MALATQCPHCHTTFRVAADQLKLRGGIVRCGACQQVFDGNAHLVDLAAATAARPAPPAPAAPAVPDVTPPPSPSGEAQPVYAIDVDHALDPLGILPDVVPQAEAAPEAETETDPAPQPAPAPAPAPLASHPMTAPATPFTHSGPQVWRTAARRRPEQAHADLDGDVGGAVDGDADVDASRGADAGTGAPDPAAAAIAAVQPDTLVAAAADVPQQATEANEAAQAATDTPPTYAPAGRIEPRLEPLHGAAPDAAADTDAAAAPGAAPPGDTAPTPAPPASAFAPRARVVPQPAVHESGSAPATVPDGPAQRIEPTFDLPVDEEIVAQALPYDDDHHDDHDDHHHGADHGDARAPAPDQGMAPSAAPPDAPETAPAAVPAVMAAADDGIATAALPLRASAADASHAPLASAAAKSARSRALDARTRRSSLKPTRIEAPRLRLPHDDVDEPEFVKRSRRQERSGRTRRMLMGAGSVVLALALAVQAAYQFRTTLAARHPGLKPALQGLCAALGCRIDLPAQADSLAIETGELATLGPGTYSLNTLLRNQGNLVQAWPSIELELTDAANKPVLRRVFAPAEYLPPGVPAAAGFAPRSEQPVRLHFALADIQPSDYHLFVFYP
ncbi:DUF3426 domain-containing protein [uncultured Massilia sp.]|uniref:DUF3426 domain-containing protein n=1 Tax=uncultured Massilia sp. TaxID=169973 RepID=UPI0025FB5B1D|nr:DUF3426 domain-containing protein [uncultured Massilia sp.]